MIYLNLHMPRGGSTSSPDPMLQLLQMLVSDREAERAERQANLTTLQQIAQMANNNQGHGNQDIHGSKLKNFQNTNPPVFTKSEIPTMLMIGCKPWRTIWKLQEWKLTRKCCLLHTTWPEMKA